MRLRTVPIVALGLLVTAPAFGDKPAKNQHATEPHGSKHEGDKSEDKGKDDKGKPEGKDKDDKGRPEGKDKDDKGKPEDKGKDDKGKPEEPPGLEGREDEHHQKLLERFNERKKTADERRRHDREQIRRQWGAALANPVAQGEIRRHAMTVAKLDRIKDVAEAGGKPDLLGRANAALERENARHDRKMKELSANAAPAASGGAP